MPGWLRWGLGIAIVAAIVAIPTIRYRMIYSNEKRFRVVSEGNFYRCGQMTADGFRKKLREHQIKLVINLQDEHPDPMLSEGYWDKPYVRESQICNEEGAEFVFLSFAEDRGLLPRNAASLDKRPSVIDEFLSVCDKHKGQPILIHCMAGLHRTGLLTAIYRLEYEGWTVAEAVRELRANGFGDRKCTTANDYIYEYLYLYQPRSERAKTKGEKAEKK
jgi:tyrosine-protein phosphatase SIW14